MIFRGMALSCLVLLGQYAPAGAHFPVSGGAPTSFAFIASSTTGCFNPAGTNNKCVFALHVNPSAANLIFCHATWNDSGAISFTLSGSASGTFTAIGSKIAGSGTGTTGFSGQDFWVKAAGGADTLTGTASGAGGSPYVSWLCTVYSYSGTLSSTDGTPGYSNTAAVASVATLNGTTMGTSLVTTGSSDVVIASCIGVQGTCSSAGSYTSRNDTNACSYSGTTCTTGQNFNTNDGGLIEDQVGVAAGTQTATFGTSNATSSFTGGLTAF